eukprot:gene15744-biopygen7837
MPGSGFHLGFVGGHDHVVGALATAFFSLARGAGEQRHFRAHGLGELDAHMAQTAHAQNANLVASLHAVVLERRVSGDAGTEDRRGAGQVELGRDLHHEVLADHDAVGVAAHGVAAIDPVWRGVGHGRAFEAVLLEVGVAGVAVTAGVDHAANTHQVADFVRGDAGADGGDFTDDLVARHQRVHGDAPFVACLVDVGVADAAVENFDRHVIGARATAFEGHGGEGSGGRLSGITDGGVHGETSQVQ